MPTADTAPEGRATVGRGTTLAVGLLSVAVLAFELGLVRLFDVVLDPSYGYTVLTSALFAMGAAGFVGAVWQRPVELSRVALWIAVAMAGQTFVLNAIPFDVVELFARPATQILWFGAIFATVALPFFFFGRFLIAVFAGAPARIGVLYSINLVGSAVGVAILPLIPAVGPGGISLVSAALAVVAAGILADRWPWRAVAVVVALVGAATPFVLGAGPFEVRGFVDKHSVRHFRDRGEIELSRWDPVSRIDVIPIVTHDPKTGQMRERFKHVAYDGGSQTTRFTPFDGDIAGLRRRLDANPGLSSDFFWQRGLLAPHHLKRDTGARVLVIGAGGGQDVLAALVYGAQRVDAVEMVGAVVDLALTTYGDYIGGIYTHPAVRTFVAEGRAFLRSRATRYDIIQVFSNHTSSTMAVGTGAFTPEYLQTVEAYREFFEHLDDGGVLHVSHHAYPRMITTAALAWRRMGRTDFQRHVVVFERDLPSDLLPTFLVKMTPWNAAEIEELRQLFSRLGWQENYRYKLVENPLDATKSFLPARFFGGDPGALATRDYRVSPCTDDRPYFNFLRTRADRLPVDRDPHLDRTTREFLNSRLVDGWLPSELLHLILPALLGLLLLTIAALAAPFVPALRRIPRRNTLAVYFGCTGFGFIAVELTLVQLCIKPVGVPLHAYSTVLFTVLLGSGVGSLAVQRLELGSGRRWVAAFAGIVATIALFQLAHESVFSTLLGWPLWARLAGVATLILPIGVFLGMPFPLGILTLTREARGSIAWAFGINSMCTVLGGVLATAATMAFGFRAVLWAALLGYVLCGVALPALRRN